MRWKPRGWALIGMLLMAIPSAMTVLKVAAAVAQSTGESSIATTQVTDTVYRADGTLANGTVLVSWQAFTTAIGQSIPNGSTSAAITNGVLSVQLVPNAGATPMGSYYTAVYHLDDGTVSREFWVVPASQTPVQVSAIKSTVLPTSVAMQTVSKSYVDTAIAAAVSGHPLDSSSPFVMKAGDTMTGPLVLPADPTAANQAADKHYVDVNVAAVEAGLGQKVSLLPSGTQAVTQPVGTQLQVNHLNGEEYASQYVNGLGANGIANALASPDCASGCDVKVERSYNAGENYSAAAWNSGSGGTHVQDDRNGQRHDSYLNPTSATSNGNDVGQIIDVVSTRSSAAEFAAGGSEAPSSSALMLTHEGVTGGSNLFPQTIENVPYFKTNYNAMSVTGTYNTMGQHQLDGRKISCYGVGDCLIGSQFIVSSGGLRDEADEGAHPFDLQVAEDSAVFEGTCSTGCTPGSMVVMVAVTSSPGTQGEGRYLINKNPAKVITAGVLTGGSGNIGTGPGQTASFSGSNFPVSVFLATAQVIPSQANNIAPGTVTVAIATSGVTAGFATNTAAVPSPSGVACVVDQLASGSPPNYEMANYSVVDGTHVQMTLNKAHQVGATIAFGGLCGYGLEQTVDTVGQIRQVFPVIGSYSTTGLYYGGHLTPIVGLQGNTSAFLNVSMQIASIVRSNNVVTVTTAGNLPVDVNGLTMTVAGVADQSYNGSFIVTTTGINTLTYAQAGANSTSMSGSVSKLTGGYALYPMAEVLGVFDTATKSIDGQLTLAANTVPWAANDPVEEPHYYQQAIAADVTFISQTTPRPTLAQAAGVAYESNVGPGLSGWTVTNGAPAASYLGSGGTHSVPHAAYGASGIWLRTMEAQAGEESVFTIHCNSHGCGNWNSGYNLFEFDSSTGGDRISYQPLTSTMLMGFGNAGYQFSPQAFTAGTINAGTVNATTLNGAVSAAQLPLFGGSGSTHAPGAVPDPGATAGTARYLREDGAWDVPSGGVSGSGQSAGGGASGSATIPGAMADYSFTQGTGSVLTDITGNGNDGTLGTGSFAPAWTTTGLSFQPGQNVSLPAAINSTETLFIAVYLNPLTAGVQVSNQFPVLISSSNGSNGFNFLVANDYGPSTYVGSAWSPSLYINGQHATSAPNLLSGFHVLAVVLGTGSGDLDHLYIDGVEVAVYTHQSSSANQQTSGNLFLGSSGINPWNGSGINGTVYRMATFSTQLSASQVQSITATIRTEVASRGVATSPVNISQGTPVFHAIGDSITFGQGVSTPWPSLLSLTNQPNYAITNWGIAGIALIDVDGSEPNRAALRCRSSYGPSLAIVFAGTNDFALYAPPAGQVMTSLQAEIQTMKDAGCRVFVGTMLSRSGNDPDGNAMDADKDAYDALILQQAKAGGADGVIDFAANPLLGADGAYASPNSTGCSGGPCFQSDGIHPTQTGQEQLAAAASNALNYYFGYNESSPHVVTALPYSMTAGDGAVSLAGVTGAGTLALPDCTGQSGAVYRINNPQAVFAVTVAPLNGSQLINGLSIATVPANGSLVLRDVPNPKTVSGCHWEM